MTEEKKHRKKVVAEVVVRPRKDPSELVIHDCIDEICQIFPDAPFVSFSWPADFVWPDGTKPLIMYVAGVAVGPHQARLLRQRIWFNRKLVESNARKFASEMAAVPSEWGLNPQPILVSDQGETLDGQTRLEGIIRSGATVPMVIIVNSPSRSRFCIDANAMRRTWQNIDIYRGINAQWLREGADSKKITADAKHIARIELGVQSRPEMDGVVEIVNRHIVGFQFMGGGAAGWHWDAPYQCRPLGVYGGAGLRAALIYAFQAKPRLVAQIVRRLVDGARLDEGSPILAYRDFMLTLRAKASRHGLGEKEWPTLLRAAEMIRATAENEQKVAKDFEDEKLTYAGLNWITRARHRKHLVRGKEFDDATGLPIIDSSADAD